MDVTTPSSVLLGLCLLYFIGGCLTTWIIISASRQKESMDINLKDWYPRYDIQNKVYMWIRRESRPDRRKRRVFPAIVRKD